MRRKKKKPIWKTGHSGQRIRCRRCGKSFNERSRRDNFNLFRGEPGKMAQQVFLDVLAASLDISGVARAQSVGDVPAEAPRPTKEFRVMYVLDIVHAEHRGPAAVEAPQHGSRRIKDIRFGVHQLADLLESEIAGEFVKSATAGKGCCAADTVPQGEELVANDCDLEIIAIPKLLVEMLIPLGDKYAESASVARAGKAFQKSQDVRGDTADKGRIDVETVDSDSH